MVSGDEVEVFSCFEGSWVRGFVIHRIESVEGSGDDACTLRRLSDDAVLPIRFSPGDLRPAHPSRWPTWDARPAPATSDELWRRAPSEW